MFHNEVDYVMEAITAVLFMIIGVFGVAYMILTLEPRVGIRTTIDKVGVNPVNFEEDNYPFLYTGYQAYMFAWMMDGTTDTELTWVANPNAKFGDSPKSDTYDSKNTGHWITLAVTDSPSSFLVTRNRAIVGVQEFAKGGSIRDTVQAMACYIHGHIPDCWNKDDPDSTHKEDIPKQRCVRYFYNPKYDASALKSGCDTEASYVRLDFTDGSKCVDASDRHIAVETDTDNYKRFEYSWILHPCKQKN